MKNLKKFLSKKIIAIIVSFSIPTILVIAKIKDFELWTAAFFIAIVGILTFLIMMLLVNCIINLKKRRWFRLILDTVLVLLLMFVIVVLFSNTIFYGPQPSRAKDARRVSDIHQTELALKLYYVAYREYPSNIQVLVDKNFLNMSKLPIDPKTEQPHNYAYGINKQTGKIEYYHIGTILENKTSDMLAWDEDYDSSLDTNLIDWQYDKNYIGPCLTENGFDGSDEGNCGAVYDRGILPEN